MTNIDDDRDIKIRSQIEITSGQAKCRNLTKNWSCMDSVFEIQANFQR